MRQFKNRAQRNRVESVLFELFTLIVKFLYKKQNYMNTKTVITIVLKMTANYLKHFTTITLIGKNDSLNSITYSYTCYLHYNYIVTQTNLYVVFSYCDLVYHKPKPYSLNNKLGHLKSVLRIAYITRGSCRQMYVVQLITQQKAPSATRTWNTSWSKVILISGDLSLQVSTSH